MTSSSSDDPRPLLEGKRVVHVTPAGQVTIRSLCPPDFFGNLRLDEGLGHFSHYTSIIHRVDDFRTIASRQGSNVTLALKDPEVIVAYATCWYPGPEDRWSALGDLMYEVGTIEVSRNYRGMHIAQGILRIILEDNFIEDKIVYMQGYSWHWDLEGNGISAAEYRKLMMKLYGRFGFREVYTNDPNIALRVENVMMMRVGSRVSPEDQKKFRYLRFGIKTSR